MRLTESQAVIRPRSPWEALDLGVRLAREHLRVLMISWALLTLPVLALLTAALWNYPSVVILVFWWLKPLFERLPLHILSRALFGETITVRQALTVYPQLLKVQLLSSLLWRRFTPKRSFLLPVQQLERLSGATRQARVRILTQENTQAASWLTIVGAHIEMALYVGLLGLIYLFIPSQIVEQLDWLKLIDVEAHGLLWIEHLTNLLYALVLLVWEPVYVACGFSLYLNRRTALEAWDIELVFRRLRQRLMGVVHLLVLVGVVGMLLLPPPALAEEITAPAMCPLPPQEVAGPDAPHLLNQPLNSQVARQHMNAILASQPFKNEHTQLQWHVGQQGKDKKSSAESQGMHWRDLEVLLAHAARFLEILLWTLLVLGTGLLIWRYRVWLKLFTRRITAKPTSPIDTPHQLFGLEVAPNSLPADIPGEAERLWHQEPRKALGLLYRGLLSHLLHDFHLPLKEAHTEGEILELSKSMPRADIVDYLHNVTMQWQRLAYGHQMPTQETLKALCHQWRILFNPQVPA
jgi:hypothetical protein